MENLALASGGIDFAMRGDTGVLTLRRPQTKNALTLAMYQDMVKVLEYCASATSVRCLCVTGSEGQFCSGNDLRDFLDNAVLAGEGSPLRAFIFAVIEFPKPLIAAVEGVAYGIGTTLLLHCDYVVAHPEASFCLPFVSLGLVPEFGASWLLARQVGAGRARQWLLSGESIAAEQALTAGLVQDLSENPLDAGLFKAQQFARQAPMAQVATKRLLREAQAGQLQRIIEAEIEVFQRALGGVEFREAVTAFLEKRAAGFNKGAV